jgi:hypothetical protein
MSVISFTSNLTMPGAKSDDNVSRRLVQSLNDRTAERILTVNNFLKGRAQSRTSYNYKK